MSYFPWVFSVQRFEIGQSTKEQRPGGDFVQKLLKAFSISQYLPNWRRYKTSEKPAPFRHMGSLGCRLHIIAVTADAYSDSQKSGEIQKKTHFP